MALSKQKNAAKNQELSEAGDILHAGEILRQGRESHGLTIDMVADELMIRRFYLEAIEAGSYKDLPERVYATGFIKNYAKYLGMDVPVLVDQFKRDAYGSRTAANYQVDLNMPEPVTHSVVPGRSALLSAVVVLALVIAGIVFLTRSGHDNAATSIPAPDISTDSAPAAAAPASPAKPSAAAEPALFAGAASVSDSGENDASTGSPPDVAPAAATPPAPAIPAGQPRRVLEALQSSWVEVKDERGAILFTSILKSGQLLPLPEGKKMFVTTGNAGGLRLVLDGQAQPAFGQVNEVKRNIAVAADTAPAAGR